MRKECSDSISYFRTPVYFIRSCNCCLKIICLQVFSPDLLLLSQAREASVYASSPAEEDSADGDISTASKASSNYSKITDDGQLQFMNYRVTMNRCATEWDSN